MTHKQVPVKLPIKLITVEKCGTTTATRRDAPRNIGRVIKSHTQWYFDSLLSVGKYRIKASSKDSPRTKINNGIVNTANIITSVLLAMLKALFPSRLTVATSAVSLPNANTIKTPNTALRIVAMVNVTFIIGLKLPGFFILASMLERYG